MAKQSGIHQLNGKLGKVSYYRQKYVEDGLARTINEGMSARVKTAPEYENTRKNASEFGSAGSTSGAMVRPLTQRWRYILDPFTTGKLNADIVRLLKNDTTGEWGQRQLDGATWQAQAVDALNKYVKLDYISNFAYGEATYTKDSGSVKFGGEWDVTSQTSQAIKARGAEGVVYQFYGWGALASTFNSSTQQYSKAASFITPLLDSVDIEIGEDSIIPLADLSSFDDTLNIFGNSAGVFGLLVVTLPYKVINNTKYTLQELCSARIVVPAEE